MYTIQTNEKGSRSLSISENHLETIKQYSLFDHFIDSNGIVDENILNRLKLTLQSIIMSQETADKGLLSLCFDIIFNNNMKAYGLNQLVVLYINWTESLLEKQIETFEEIEKLE